MSEDDSQTKTELPAEAQALPAEARALPPGFEALELLGEGGFGVVYKANFKPLDRLVAVKIIRRLNTHDSDAEADQNKQFAQIQREAKILARLNHPNIVHVHQVGVCSDGRPYLVCEYIKGVPLDKMLADEEKLSFYEIRSIFDQLIDALDYAHAEGLLHRDIKPSNIMILNSEGKITDSRTPSGNTTRGAGITRRQVKLLDFGIAREFEKLENLSSEAKKHESTMTAAHVGSPLYMSPEQCSGLKLSASSDFYSLACVLFECLYGTPPFTGDSALAIQYQQINQSIDDSQCLKNEKNTDLAKFLSQALSKDPVNRPQNAKEFRSAFHRALRLEPTAAPKNYWPAIIGGLAVCMLLASTLLIMKQKQVTDAGGSQNQNNNKTPTHTLSRYSSKPRMTVEFQLHSLIEQAKPTNLVDETLDERSARRKRLLIEVEKLLPQVKDKQALNYVALFLMADLKRDLHYPTAESIQAYRKALAISKTQDGRDTYDSIQCYVSLVPLQLTQGELDEAYKSIKKGDELFRSHDKDPDSLPHLKIPDTLAKIKLQPLPLEILMAKANVEAHRKEYEASLNSYSEAAKFLTGWWGPSGAVIPVLNQADILKKMRKNTEAKSLVLEQLRLVDAQKITSPNTGLRQDEGIYDIAFWFYLDKDIANARKAINVGLAKRQDHAPRNKSVADFMDSAIPELDKTGKIDFWEKNGFWNTLPH